MQIPISGMSCQGCASSIEAAVKSLPGAQNVSVNFALKQLSVDGVASSEIIKSIRKLGYDSPGDFSSQKVEATVFHTKDVSSISENETKASKCVFFISAIFGIPEFVIGMMGEMHALPFHVPAFMEALLAGIVVLGAGFGIHRRTVRQLSQGVLSMDTLVTLGSLAAFGRSLLLWQQGFEMTGFESSSTIVMFILLGRYLEASARKRTFSATTELYKTLEQEVVVLSSGEKKKISGLKLLVGDVFFLSPGDVSPADGTVVEGAAQVDTSRITGESTPRGMVQGDSILSGSTILDSPITVRVTKSGAASFIGKLLLELEKAQSAPVKLQRVADKMTTYFVPAVILAASLAAYIQYVLTANPHLAFNILLSVLLIACPCALGLAIPTALVTALGACAKKGILFRDAATLEVCSKITEILFDKTGTVTLGKPTVTHIEVFGNHPEKEALLLASQLEVHSKHPLAIAIRSFNEKQNPLGSGQKVSEVKNFKLLIDGGVEGVIDGAAVRLLKAHSAGGVEKQIGGTASDLFVDGIKIARFLFEDDLQPEALTVLRELKRRRIKIKLLTGDNLIAVQKLQEKLEGIFDEIHGDLLPEDKQKMIVEARKKNSKGAVGFVGDGVNDVLALASATVGFAIANGAPAAIGAGHVTLTRGLPDLLLALDSASLTARQLKFNLFYAVIYNILMLPLAVTGFVNPMWASLAMSLSSVSVVLNSLMLGVRIKFFMASSDGS